MWGKNSALTFETICIRRLLFSKSFCAVLSASTANSFLRPSLLLNKADSIYTCRVAGLFQPEIDNLIPGTAFETSEGKLIQISTLCLTLLEQCMKHESWARELERWWEGTQWDSRKIQMWNGFIFSIFRKRVNGYLSFFVKCSAFSLDILVWW